MSISKVAVITGGASGLGYELANQLQTKNIEVIVLDKKPCLSLPSYICDITDESIVKDTIDKILLKYKKIDILVNCAGVWTDDNLEKSNPGLKRQTIETNVLGQINVIDSLMEHFKHNNSGTIANVISTAGVADVPAGNNKDWKVYGASKWAMTGYSNALRLELLETKIRFIQFFPAGFESNLYETAGRENAHNQSWMMDVKDVAEVLMFAILHPKVCLEKIVVSKSN